MATASVPGPSRRQIVSRIAAGVVGGYAFTWGFIALGMGTLFAAGMPFHDAESLSTMLAFIVFLVVFCWAFTAVNVTRVWVALAAGGALMTGAAALVQRAIV